MTCPRQGRERLRAEPLEIEQCVTCGSLRRGVCPRRPSQRLDQDCPANGPEFVCGPPPIQIRRDSPAVTANSPDRTQRPGPLVPSGEAISEPSLPLLDLDGVRRRDPDALAALFDRYFDRLYAVVYRMLGNRAETEDAIQEVFLKVHRGAPSLDPARDPDRKSVV